MRAGDRPHRQAALALASIAAGFALLAADLAAAAGLGHPGTPFLLLSKRLLRRYSSRVSYRDVGFPSSFPDFPFIPKMSLSTLSSVSEARLLLFGISSSVRTDSPFFWSFGDD